MARKVKQIRKKPQRPQRKAEPTRKRRRRQDAGCTCTLKLADSPIVLDRVESGPKGIFKPNYEKAPACDGDGCEMQVHYQWSIKVLEGDPVLSDATAEMASVTGLGRFELRLRVTVSCIKTVGQDDQGNAIRVVAFKSEAGSQEYAVV
ncbi:hypothetical protein [Dongia sp. agr-C8]